MPDATPTSTIINMTIEEEQMRKTRAIHVRVTGIKDTENVEEEVKELLKRIGILELTHRSAWRVGKKALGEKGSSKESTHYAFPDLGNKEGFLGKKTST